MNYKIGDYFKVTQTTFLFSIPGATDCGWVGLVWEGHYGVIEGISSDKGFYYVKMLKSETVSKHGAIEEDCIKKISKDELMVDSL